VFWAVPVLVCHDEIVVEYEAEQAADVKSWLEKAMVEGMDADLELAPIGGQLVAHNNS
jgi:DNA polymerase I-like protein with 3'-5' exonuclease and polymerase domains